MKDNVNLRINNLYSRIKTVIDTAQQNIYRAINENMLLSYWNIGMLIVEDEQGGEIRAEYGKRILKELSKRLTSEYGKGYSISNIQYFRQFYLAFPIHHTCGELETKTTLQKNHTCGELQFRHEVSWSHYRLLMRISDLIEREFYINECAAQMWSVKELERQIDSLYYKRYLTTGKIGADKNNLPAKYIPSDFIKDPFVMEFVGISPRTDFTEKQLEQSLIDNLQKFILELGKGFAFVARQQRIVTETSNFYIDLTFYNYILKCFVIIDLKIGKLTHQDIGQMDMYVRMFDDLKRNEGDNSTIGLILCTEKEETVVKYSVLAENKQLFASKYLLYLPTEEQLVREIEREKMYFELQKGEEEQQANRS